MNDSEPENAAAHPSWELVLDMAVEGGGFTLFRRATPNGWRYRAGKGTIALDDHDDEEWRTFQTDAVSDWEALLPSQLRYWHPLFVHADLRAALRRLVAEGNETPSYWTRERQTRWSRALGDAPPQKNGDRVGNET